MSRIAKYPVDLPKGVETNFAAEVLSVKGPMGSLSQAIHQSVKIVKEGDALTFHPADETALANAMSGTMRALVANMVTGVTKGFERKLTLVGVGYLQFKFEIAQGPQAPQDHLGLAAGGEIHSQTIETANLHPAEVGSGSADLLQPLFKAKGGLFAWVLQHRHHHAVEEPGAALDQVEMAQGEGIEAAGVEGAHRASLWVPEAFLGWM